MTTFITYLILTRLAQKGFSAVLLPGSNPIAVVAVQNNPKNSCPSSAGSYSNERSRDVGCGGKFDTFGLCKNLWYSTLLKHSISPSVISVGAT